MVQLLSRQLRRSLGRLTLNILLSFAQFERELIGERTRDKMSAGRRKGKWAGGCPVLGYDVDPGGTHCPALALRVQAHVVGVLAIVLPCIRVPPSASRRIRNRAVRSDEVAAS